jgi:hypothetical protein
MWSRSRLMTVLNIATEKGSPWKIPTFRSTGLVDHALLTRDYSLLVAIQVGGKNNQF